MIHRYWTGPAPATEPWVGWVVRGLHADVRDWSDATLPAELHRFLDQMGGRVRAQDTLRHRANIVRLWLLREFGGVWLDHDVVPLRRLDDDERPFAAAHGGTLCNCAMGFDQGDPLLTDALDLIGAAPRSRDALSPVVSGELLLGDLWSRRVEWRQLPFDALGRATRGAEPWALHLFASASKN